MVNIAARDNGRAVVVSGDWDDAGQAVNNDASGGLGGAWTNLGAHLALFRLAALTIAGHRFWLLPILPLGWLLVLAGAVLLGLSEGGFQPRAAQGTLIGVPLTALAVFLGLRVIAGEIDGRSLEIVYTVPGGCERVWWVKLIAAVMLVGVAEALLAAVTWLLFTEFPLAGLYGALQPAVFYMVLAMALATLFRSEVAGAMATAVVLGVNGLITGFGTNQVRISPFWNALAVDGADAAEVLAWTVQNRLGVALVTLGILALAFMRANRRERMLGG